jgi:hypothetical protein
MLPAWLAELALPAPLAEAPLTSPLAASLAAPLAASLAEADVVSLLEETRFLPLVPCSDIFSPFLIKSRKKLNFVQKQPLFYTFFPLKKTAAEAEKNAVSSVFENAAFFYPERERDR